MGRFSAAKMIGAIDAKFQRYYNMLIDLLDTGYMVEKTINGKRVKVSIDPQEVISVTVDDVKVFGVDSTGAVFATKIGNPQNPSVSYGIMGDAGTPGGVSFSLYDRDQQDGHIFRVTQTLIAGVTAGFAFVDSNDVTRIGISKDGNFYVYDESGGFRFYALTDGSFHVRNETNTKSVINITTTVAEIKTPTATDNRVGADETGPYYVKAGAKTYF